MKRKSLMKKGIAIITAAITVFASASTILAYEPFISGDKNTTKVVGSSEVVGVLKENSADKCDFSVSDVVIVHENGIQVPVVDIDNSLYAICNHVMEKCYLHAHNSNSSGGCTVRVYNAQQCKKCGYIKTGSLHSTHTYTVCPHK